MGVNGIYGLSGSGIDVESMVKVGMMSKQSEYDKMYKKEVKDEWIKSAYSDVYSSLYTFTNTTLSKYKLQSTMDAMKASSSDSTVVTATANADAAEMSHQVTVSSLASNAYLLSTKAVNRAATTTTTAADGTTSTAESTSIYLKDVVFSSFTKNSDGTYSAVNSNGSVTNAAATDTAISFNIGDGSTTKTVSYTYADLNDSKTLNDLASDIKSSGVNVQASYDSANDSFTLYNKDSGLKNTLALSVASSTDTGYSADAAAAGKILLNSLNLGAVTSTNGTTTIGSAQSFNSASSISAAGTNATVNIDGKDYTPTENKMTVSNVIYTFVGTTSGTSSKVTVTQDTDSIMSSVKQFVSDYNTMIDSLNSKIYETKYSDYEPLTKSQESAMTSTQISDWNTKAKSGLLYHSSQLRSIVSNMREALYTPVDSITTNYNSAAAIGITSSTDQGHITLDEDKLKAALAADPDSVYQIFAASQDTASSLDGNQDKSSAKASDYSNTGIANRLFSSLNAGVSLIKDYAGTSSTTDDSSTLGTLISNLKNKMSDFKTQMDAYEDMLYTKYDAMETAIQQLSSQLSTVTSSFS